MYPYRKNSVRVRINSTLQKDMVGELGHLITESSLFFPKCAVLVLAINIFILKWVVFFP